MKTHVIATCILLTIGWTQCAANFLDSGDPLGIYRQGLGISAAYAQNSGEPSALDVAIKTAYPLDQQLIIGTDSLDQPPPNDFLRRLASPIKSSLQLIINITKAVLSIPIKVIRFLLWPVKFLFNITKFFLKVFFLPVTLGWKAVKMLLYPVKVLLNSFTTANPPPPYVIGVPNQNPYIPTVYGR